MDESVREMCAWGIAREDPGHELGKRTLAYIRPPGLPPVHIWQSSESTVYRCSTWNPIYESFLAHLNFTFGDTDVNDDRRARHS